MAICKEIYCVKVGRLIDIVLAPVVAAAALPMLATRYFPLPEIPLTRKVLNFLGYYPIRKHYYDPLFDGRDLKNLDQPRRLPGIDLRLASQIELIRKFSAANEIEQALRDEGFDFKNLNFRPGDADAWFQIIRHFQPARIVEIGSGHSTRVARAALRRNTRQCRHICIEPYEMPWLEALGVEVIRERVEFVNRDVFEALEANDILFIDSSHMIRPQGDVLVEILEILPTLRPGVIVHIHDIFTPRDYPRSWLEQPRFWNEQYLLEAFLTQNDSWDVLLACNMLKHEKADLLRTLFPLMQDDSDPGSFYIVRK